MYNDCNGYRFPPGKLVFESDTENFTDSQQLFRWMEHSLGVQVQQVVM